MNVVFLNPSFPAEMPLFAKGLAHVGARVFAVGQTPAAALEPGLRDALTDYLHVPDLFDEDDLIRRVHAWLRGRSVDRIEAAWEPLVIAAARMRDLWGVPGMSEDTVRGFRDKQLMKERVAAAGLRVPYSARIRTAAQAWEAAERVGYPLILKPIAGAGSADTYRVDGPDDLTRTLARMGHVVEASCEEFVQGDEFTYDTICVDGVPLYENVAQYLPRPLIARTHERLSPVIVTLADLSQPGLQGGLEMGRSVLTALGMERGFTHMEWYRTGSGEVVFGEIGCRPGGARLVDQMNFTSDVDLFVEWARAVCWGDVRIERPRTYNAAIVFKRALGQGRIQSVQGLDAFLARWGDAVCVQALLRPGQRRRDWKATLLSDGFLIVRHRDLDTAIHIAKQAGDGITLLAE